MKKKLISFLLAAIMVTSVWMVPELGVHAEEATEEKSDSVVQTTGEKDLSRIVVFLAHEEDGTISLDGNAARAAGYAEEEVAYVENTVAYMNQLVGEGSAYIDEEFRAVIAGVQSRAKGQSKVVIYPYGPVQLYLNSSEASQVKTALDAVGKACTFMKIAGRVTGATKNHFIQVANTVGDLVLGMYRVQYNKAVKSGTGILITIVDADSSGLNKMITISAQ